MHWFLDPIQNHYLDFNGRATRQQYWMFVLYYFLVSVALFIFVAMLPVLGALIFIFMLAMILPSISISVRRLHDIGWSGWWLWLNFIPFGGLVLLVLMLIPGQTKDNQYGPNPYSMNSQSAGTSNDMSSGSGTSQLTSMLVPKPPAPEPVVENKETPKEENTQRGYGD